MTKARRQLSVTLLVTFVLLLVADFDVRARSAGRSVVPLLPTPRRVQHHEGMYVPPGLTDFDDLIYRTGRVARTEVLLQYANEQLFFELVGRGSRAVHSLSSKSHAGIISANRRMIESSDLDHELKKIAFALFKRSQKAIQLRDAVVHGVFVRLEEPGSLIRVNSDVNERFDWTVEHFDEAHTALRRARQSTTALEELVAGANPHQQTSLRLIAQDIFVLYGNNSVMASTPEGRRTDPETIPT